MLAKWLKPRVEPQLKPYLGGKPGRYSASKVGYGWVSHHGLMTTARFVLMQTLVVSGLAASGDSADFQ